MKSIFTLISCMLVFQQVVEAQTGTIIFKISNIEATADGSISVGIFTKERFPKMGEQFKGIVEKANSSTIEIVMNDVPAGKYGAAAFHDLDGSGKLNTNFIGFPTEPVGFANGAKIRFGPPTFEAAMITVAIGKITSVNIRLD